METLSGIEVPADPGPLKRAEDRWKSYVDDPGDALIFAGHALTHTDWAPDNVLIAPDRAWLIDWAWPNLGAAWTDPACWLLRLMAAGDHTAAAAEHQATRLPAFAAAAAAHLDLFARASVPHVGRNPAGEQERLDEEDGAGGTGMVRLPRGQLILT